MKLVHICSKTFLAIGLAACIGLQGCSSMTGLVNWKKGDGNSISSRFFFKPGNDTEQKEFSLAYGLEASGKLDEARAAYRVFLQKKPDHIEALHRLALLEDQQRRHREAQKLYARAIQLNPEQAQLFNDLGYSFYLSGDLPKAESAMGKAVALSPTTARFHNNLGLILGQMGRLDEALAEFRQAGSEADAQYNLAFIYSSQGRFGEATRYFQAALQSDPQHELARRALESFTRFEQDPHDIDVDGEMDENGVRYVPYVEPMPGSQPANDQTLVSAQMAG